MLSWIAFQHPKTDLDLVILDVFSQPPEMKLELAYSLREILKASSMTFFSSKLNPV